MWDPDNPKLIVANGNWATAQLPGQRSFRLGRQEKPWFAMKADTGVQIGEYFATHAEAIAYAQNEARLTCASCGRRMPYLEACIDGRPYCHPEQGRDCYQEVRWPGIYTQDFIDASKMLAVRPIDRYTFTRAPILKNGSKP